MNDPTILLFHPDPVEVRVLTGMLRSAGYRVVAVAGARDARVVLAAESVRVALVDGERNLGVSAQILREVERRSESVACVLVAGSDQARFVERALGGGRAVAVVPAPATASDLLATVSLAMTDPEALRPARAEPRGASEAREGRFTWSDSQVG